jgi:hypothetical protein
VTPVRWGRIINAVLLGLLVACGLPFGVFASLDGVASPLTGDAGDVEWNPAALGETGYQLQFLVTPVSGRFRTDDWSIASAGSLLAGLLAPAERSSLIGELSEGDLKGSFDLRGGAHVAIGGNGVGATVRGHVQGKMTADAARLFLLEGVPGYTYQLAGTEAEGVIIGAVHVTSVYSDPWLAKTLHIAGFHMGGTLRYLHGMEYARAQMAGPTLEIVEEGGEYKKLGDGRLYTWTSHSGWGLATDLGLLVRLTPSLAVEASIIDLGRTWWSKLQEAIYEYKVDAATGAGALEAVASRPVAGQPYWDLPGTIRGGISVEASPGVLWSLQYSRRLFGSQAGSYEWVLATQLNRLKFLPLRLGAKYSDGSKGLTFSLGVGVRLGALTFDIGTPNLGGLLTRGKEMSLAASTGLRF